MSSCVLQVPPPCQPSIMCGDRSRGHGRPSSVKGRVSRLGRAVMMDEDDDDTDDNYNDDDSDAGDSDGCGRDDSGDVDHDDDDVDDDAD
eukprot:6799537-Pyramimonas_sp.AAC.1